MYYLCTIYEATYEAISSHKVCYQMKSRRKLMWEKLHKVELFFIEIFLKGSIIP